MAVIGDLVARLTADTRQFDKKLNKSRGTLASFSGLSSKAIASVGAAMGGIGLGMLAKNAITAAADFETAATSFEVLTGSARDGQKVLADITRFAAETPFEMPELQDAATKLLAFGVASDDIIPSLTSIGDIASAIGAPIGDIAYLFGTAKTQGRLFMQDINQLTNRGIPIIQELAKQFGVTEGEVKELVSSGQVGFENLQRAFTDLTGEGGRFSGMMERQSNTMWGKWAEFQDSIAAVAREFGNVLMPAAKATLDYMIPAMESLAATVKQVGEGIGFAFRNGADIAMVAAIDMQLTLYDLIPIAEGVMQNVSGTLLGLWDGLGAAFSAFVANVVAGFTEIKNVAVAIGEGVKSAIQAAFSGENPAAAFTTAFIDELASQDNAQGGGNPFTEFIEAFRETREAVREGFEAEGGGLGDALRAERQRLLDQIGQREAGAVDAAEAERKKAEDAAGGSPGAMAVPKLSEAMERGSADALSAINNAFTGRGGPMDEVAKTAKEQLAEDRKMVAELKNMNRATARPVVFTV